MYLLFIYYLFIYSRCPRVAKMATQSRVAVSPEATWRPWRPWLYGFSDEPIIVKSYMSKYM